MIVRALPVQLNCLLAVIRGSIPFFQHVFHAASQVIGFCLAARLGQQLKRFVRLAGLQGRISLGKLFILAMRGY
jgi:hypothetical protein